MSFPVTNGVTTVIAPPDGYVVDFENPQQQNVLDHYFIFGVLGSLALVCLTQRLYTKQFLTGGLQIDDVLITLAWSSYIVAPIFITCNGLSKTSLLTLYLRISPQKWFKIIIWTTIAMVASYTVTIAGLLLFGCKPIRTAWDPYVVGKCVDFPILYIAIAVANITSDVILFVIPIPTIVKLKMPLAQKVGAGIMFGIGSVTVGTSIVRMVYLPSLLGSSDIPWVAAPANVWSFVEVNLFIICGSMPTFRKFLKRFAPKLMGSSGASRPSKSAKYADGSQSKLHRQQRTGYAQFDTVEMGDLPDRKDSEQAGTRGTVVSVSGRPKGQEGAVGGELRDDSSEEAILDNKAITYSRTFQVQYSQ
ncbi:hypothetical protein ACHAQA_005388 [Verticillium albo-atrum]